MLTDAQIEQLRLESKVVSNGKSRVSDKRSHLERNYLAESASGSRYKIFVRQCNLLADNFSCGIMYQKGDGQWIILARYNGSDHPHANDIEKTSFEMKCHIHIATERYQVLSKKAEKYAEVTDRYNTVDGALACLVMDWKVTGLGHEASPKNGDLFND